MENKTDSSFERSIIFRVVAIIVCIIIAGSSFFGLAKSYSSPESKINKETIKYLDEKKTTALELSASATAVSTLITLAPGDDGTPVANKLMDLAGYFCIVTSEKMSAKEAIELYKSRDVSEKLFRGDKSYLGNKSIRVYSEESARAKIFVEFVAMIVRCKMYIKLKEEMKKLDKKLNYMTVPAAIKELEKIEMVRQLDNIYRLDHAVTANQKVILKAFGLDANSIKYFASELSKELKEAE